LIHTTDSRNEGIVERTVQFSFPTDSDGFISQKCPTCRRRFKVRVSARGRYSLHYCPYCGLESDKGWLTEEQQEYVCAAGTEHVMEPLLDALARALEPIGGAGNFAALGVNCDKPIVPPKPVEADRPMALFRSDCCREPVKHDPAVSPQYCVVCGKPEWV
jgi:hypothetical protein